MSNYPPQEIYLSSKYATLKVNGDDNSDMLFYFNTPIICPVGYAMKLKLVNFTFPVAFYLVDDNNNKLYVNGALYTLTNGNYNATSLKTMLTTILSPLALTITYNTATNKFTFTRTSSFTFNSTSTCFILLGFLEGYSYSSVANSLTSTTVVNLSGQYNVVYFDVPNFTTYNLSSVIKGRTTILSSIPVAVPPGSVVFWDNTYDSHTVVQDDIISFFHIRVLGEDLTSRVEFQGQHWNATLFIEFVPRQDTTELANQTFSQAYDMYKNKLINNF